MATYQYPIERSLDGATGWDNVATIGAGAQAYSDTGLDPGTQYFYRIQTKNVDSQEVSDWVEANATTEEPEFSRTAIFLGA